jgi:NAD-dependent oxidoreductase involved in siderophore biosynthesis
LRLVHGATHIVGGAGSALLFAFLYGAPGLKILNLHPEALEETPTLTSIAAARGIDVQVLPGRCERPNPRRPANADFSIELATLSTVLDAWEHGSEML